MIMESAEEGLVKARKLFNGRNILSKRKGKGN
jgi:hypothetical protein